MIDALSARRRRRDELQEHADILVAEYGSTEYALMAHLALARCSVESGDFDAAAEAAATQVIGSAAQQPLGYLARTRLAAVLHTD